MSDVIISDVVLKWCLCVVFLAATPAIDLIQAKKKYPFLNFLKMKPCAKNGFGLFLERNGDLQIHLVCAKHFQDNDFTLTSTDSKVNRRNSREQQILQRKR